jgi:hypothetical protein
MSKMANLVVEILDLTLNGYDAEEVALMCEVPVSWVYEAIAMNEDEVLMELSRDIAEETLE